MAVLDKKVEGGAYIYELGVSVDSVVEKVSRFEREVYFKSEVEKKLRE